MSEATGEEFVGVVDMLYSEDDTRVPLGVGIRPYHAVYFIDRDHPSFSIWLALLKRSQDERVKVAFTFAVTGQRITSLAILEA